LQQQITIKTYQDYAEVRMSKSKTITSVDFWGSSSKCQMGIQILHHAPKTIPSNRMTHLQYIKSKDSIQD